MQNKILIALWLSASSLILSAQEMKLHGGFIEDSLKIGENIHYWITARYPQHMELVFPDSTYDFSPFEYAGKEYFPTQLDSTQAYDSTVYTLRSFEIDPVQYLSLRAVILRKNDSLVLSTPPDSIALVELAPVVSDTTKLRTNLSYQDVHQQFNYPLLWIILGSLVVISLVLFFVFGKRIRKALKLRKLRKEYIRFSDRLSANIRLLKDEPQSKTAELAIMDWKQFLERMEDKPFTKLTTKEIIALGYTKELKEVLKNIDRSIYSGTVSENLYKEFHSIEDYTQHRYSVIVEEIKNEK